MISAENTAAVANRPAQPGEHPLLREGPYISLAADVHPTEVAQNARRVLAIHELARTGDPTRAAQSLFDQKLCGDPEGTARILAALQEDIRSKSGSRNNCYVHVTSSCNLHCGHCYADAGFTDLREMEIDRLDRLIIEARLLGFRQVVITGGEPLMHRKRNGLLAVCRSHKGFGTNLVLRTNLTDVQSPHGDFLEGDFLAVAQAFDQIVVSVDGNEETHEQRRGSGTYARLVHNLEAYAGLYANMPSAAELSLACVMDAESINGEPGNSVRLLADSLNVRRVRFKPLLPLGRAAQLDEPVICEGLRAHLTPSDMLKEDIRPLTSCGIGQNLFIRPDGSSYPCYAWCGEHTYIGNVFEGGLGELLESDPFKRLSACTVDTIDRCRDCEYRYLCGGACRAWGNQGALDINAAPPNCDHLKTRAQALRDVARRYLTT